MSEQQHVVLGIHDGHTAGSSVIRDGRIVASVSEERLTRLKSDAGYPRRAIEEVLRLAGCGAQDIHTVALGTRFMHEREFYSNWDWYRKGYSHQMQERHLDADRRIYFIEQRLSERKEEIVGHLGVPHQRIKVIEHHQAHGATAYFGSPWACTGESVLVLTLDGSGDGICATVSIGEKGKMERLSETPSEASLGKIYSRVTYLMGMKPWEHEYKIMGLAPYADQNGVERSYEVISRLIDLDDGGLMFRRGTRLSTNYCYSYLKRQLENHRFDWVAGAIQRLVERLVVTWVKNAVAHTGIRKVVCAGGVFMNVKTNMLLLELPEITDLFVFPSCGDESIAMGAAYQAYAEYHPERGGKIAIPPLGPIYLGPKFSQQEIEEALSEKRVEGRYRLEYHKDINENIASLLASGEIVARFDGRMEWGARSLGNRSILAPPMNPEAVRELNAAIKQRDFWMPFAPTILSERQHDYIVNPREMPAPYMVLAFPTTEEGRRDLVSAIHPYDFTSRPQVLERQANPGYYDLIERYQALTGVAGILNTSFNLHGEPIVCTPADAIGTFERSGLKFLALGPYLLSKRS